jgi:hypothetical protein
MGRPMLSSSTPKKHFERMTTLERGMEYSFRAFAMIFSEIPLEYMSAYYLLC